MFDQKVSYKEILKSTSIFGGVQFFQIIILIFRSKIIAILLGPTGIGIFGLLNTSLNLMSTITNFGVNSSSIKDIATSYKHLNKKIFYEKIYIIKNIFRITGAFGMILTIIFAPLISKVTFNNSSYIFSFLLLSTTILINQITNGKLVILQGTQKLNDLAKVTLFGNLIGLTLSIPLFYFLKNDGIIYSILVYSFSNLFISEIYYKNFVKNSEIKLKIKEFINKSKEIISSGFLLGISGIITVLVNYLISIYISKNGSLIQLGLYNVAVAISINYTNIIFNAISTDYHPRLSILKNNYEIKKTVNNQAQIGLLLLTPIILVFITFGDFLIKLLYSNNFISIKPTICIILIGIYFKLYSWSISYTFVARGKIKIFFWNEIIANLYILFLGIVFYKYFNLIGLGFSYLISYVIYSIQVNIIAKKIFNFSYENIFLKQFSIQLLIAIGLFISSIYLNKNLSVAFGLISIVYFSYSTIINFFQILIRK